ncbi:MAG: hypothetical protein GX086_06340 [Alcaligenaceae bacterium]|nr:hypothetical protein [Alcaligenaceae bacterium]
MTILSTLIPVNFDAIPLFLQKYEKRWVLWSANKSGNKLPFNAETLRPMDPTTSLGSDFHVVRDVYQRHAERFNGIGLILNGDGLVGIDLDNCVDEGRAQPAALHLLMSLGCGYVEVSPSGTGLHGFGLVSEPPTFTGIKCSVNGLAIEVYACKRYLTVTGHLYSQYPNNGTPGVMRGINELVRQIKGRISTPTQETQETQVTQETHSTQVIQDAQETEVTEVIQDAQETEVTKVTKESHSRGQNNFSDLTCFEFPSRCIPTAYGMRNRCVFELARYLKGLFQDHDVEDMVGFVREWFTRYQDNIGTKDFDVTWIDFVYSWDSVKDPFGAILNSLALRFDNPLPAWMANHPFGERATRLLQICCALAEHHHPEPFFLSCRKAAEFLNFDFSDTAKLLRVLTNRGYLVEVQRGSLKGRKASAYHLGSPTQTTGSSRKSGRSP